MGFEEFGITRKEGNGGRPGRSEKRMVEGSGWRLVFVYLQEKTRRHVRFKSAEASEGSSGEGEVVNCICVCLWMREGEGL